jgi:hypothetical protein
MSACPVCFRTCPRGEGFCYEHRPPRPVLIPGEKYRHRKGGIYTLIALAKHTETGEDLVVYSAESGEVWVRPLDQFSDGRFERM